MKIRNRILGMSAILLGLAAFSCDDEEEMLVPELGVGEKVLSFDENKVQTLEITSNGVGLLMPFVIPPISSSLRVRDTETVR